MEEYSQLIEKKIILANHGTHIYFSCATLGESDLSLWDDFDAIMQKVLYIFHLNHLATLCHGI